MSQCVSCGIRRGVCPECGTFWWESGGKVYGMKPMTVEDRERMEAMWGTEPPGFEALPNAVTPGGKHLVNLRDGKPDRRGELLWVADV